MTNRIESRLQQLGLVLPAPLLAPPGVVLRFPWVRVVGRRVFVSGHAATNADGSLAMPRGKVGRDLRIDEAEESARLAGLAILGSLHRTLGNLDRIGAWCRVLGMVNVAPGFNAMPAVINGFSNLILDVFGDRIGQHARSAVGMAELPFDIAVEIEAELELVEEMEVAAPHPGS